jgi:hypothetical protein
LRRFEKKKLWIASPPKRMLDAAGLLGSDDHRPPPFNLEQLGSQVGIHGTLDHNLDIIQNIKINAYTLRTVLY